MTWTRKYPAGWTNSTSTPVNASALNNLDTGLLDAHAELDGRLSEEGLNATFVAVRTSDGKTLPPGTIVVITLDKTLAQVTANPVADIADITFQTGV